MKPSDQRLFLAGAFNLNEICKAEIVSQLGDKTPDSKALH